MVNLDNFDMGTGSNDSVDPVARLRRLIEERQAESVEILRGWMEQEEEKA
jgi:flagellar M-ring protein FliF